MNAEEPPDSSPNSDDFRTANHISNQVESVTDFRTANHLSARVESMNLDYKTARGSDDEVQPL